MPLYFRLKYCYFTSTAERFTGKTWEAHQIQCEVERGLQGVCSAARGRVFPRLLCEPERYGFTLGAHIAVERHTFYSSLKFVIQMKDKCHCSTAARLTALQTERKHEARRQDTVTRGA